MAEHGWLQPQGPPAHRRQTGRKTHPSSRGRRGDPEATPTEYTTPVGTWWIPSLAALSASEYALIAGLIAFVLAGALMVALVVMRADGRSDPEDP